MLLRRDTHRPRALLDVTARDDAAAVAPTSPNSYVNPGGDTRWMYQVMTYALTAHASV